MRAGAGAVDAADADGSFSTTLPVPQVPPGPVPVTAQCGAVVLAADLYVIITSTTGAIGSTSLTILCFFILLGGAIVIRLGGSA
jgi:hypothetical protein